MRGGWIKSHPARTDLPDFGFFQSATGLGEAMPEIFRTFLSNSFAEERQRPAWYILLIFDIFWNNDQRKRSSFSGNKCYISTALIL